MKVSEVLAVLEELAPQKLAAPWDNSGLLVGDFEQEVSGVAVALDLSSEIIRQAKAAGCNLIITHHPFIFRPQPHIVAQSYEGDMAMELIKNGMAQIACHTNWDNAKGGINYVLAEALGLKNIKPLLSVDEGAEVLLLVGDFAEPLSAEEMVAQVAADLGLPLLRAAGLNQHKKYQRLAVCGGAAMDFWHDAYACGCDALLSADPKHHEGLQAAHLGFALLDGTHFATEVIGIRRLGKLLSEKIPNLPICLTQEQDSWQFFGSDGRGL